MSAIIAMWQSAVIRLDYGNRAVNSCSMHFDTINKSFGFDQKGYFQCGESLRARDDDRGLVWKEE